MRRPPLVTGLAVLAACWLGPLPALARGSFAVHMTLHMGVVAVAAPLLALAAVGGRFDPTRHAPRRFDPLLASLVELVVVWAWHAPALHHLARSSPAWRALEQGSFLLAGLWLWIAALGGAPPRAARRAAAGIVGLLLTSMHMTLLGALLALGTRPLYGHRHGTTALGLPELADQHLGGAIMLLVGGVAYLAGGVALAARLLRLPSRAQLREAR